MAAIGFDMSNVRPPMKCNCRYQLMVLKFGLDPIYSFGDIEIFYILQFWLDIAYSRPFWRGVRGIFPPNDVTHRSNPRKALPCVETRRLSHKACKSVQRFHLGVFPRKKDRTIKQISHKVVIYRLYGEKPPLYRLEPKFAW